MEKHPVQETSSAQRLSGNQTLAVASMLFGLFFGAGNLIFPVYMGQQAGQNVGAATLGFLVTGVGIPLLAIAALANSHSSGLQELASRVSPRYGAAFTAALYLTIGPFFAIPRCASTSFSVGILPMLENPALEKPIQWGFSAMFFAAALWFSLRPGKILTWVGKILNPIFLAVLGVLLVTALVRPMGSAAAVAPEDAYREGAFFEGFLNGYNTMDALAGLAFGIVVVDVIRGMGVTDPWAAAASSLRSGALGCSLMALIYAVLALVGAQSRGLFPVSADGGEALYVIASHYFGPVGAVILWLIVTLACLKTAVGLVTSCSETFVAMTGGRIRYPVWAAAFCALSFLIANLGLSAIIAYSLPVLMLLYPLAITLIALALGGRLFDNDRRVYIATTVFTFAAGVLDFLNTLPEGIRSARWIQQLLALGAKLPLFSLGLGWVCPALAGFALGLLLRRSAASSR